MSLMASPLDGADAGPHPVPRRESPGLLGAISTAIVALYARVYGHDRTTATTYINDNVVVCVLENILSAQEIDDLAAGGQESVLDGRVAFQVGMEDEFTDAVER